MDTNEDSAPGISKFIDELYILITKKRANKKSMAAMDTNDTMMGVCAFDTLLTRNVPHILEKIFFSLDYKSFKKCQEVSTTWNQLLTSESFQKIGKSVFHKEIEEDLWDAIVEDNVDGVRRILSNGMAEVNCEHTVKLVAPHKNQRDYNTKRLPWDFHSYLGPNQYDMWERIETPLYYAARMGQKDVVQLLIERGADPNWQHGSGMTPLSLAAAKENSNVVRVLLDAGADPNKTGRWGYTPLSFARGHDHLEERGNTDVANMLRDAGAICRGPTDEM